MNKGIVAVAAGAALLLTGCGDEHKGETCVKSHSVTTYVAQKIGSVTVINPITSNVCDKWVKNHG